MQLIRLVAVLVTALPAIASAAMCNRKTGTLPPPEVVANFNKIYYQYADVFAKVASEQGLMRRQVGDPDSVITRTIDCKNNEKCYEINDAWSCYDEETSIVRRASLITMNLKNGDIIIENSITVNVYNESLPEYIKKQMDMNSRDTATASGTAAAAATGSAKAAASSALAGNATSSSALPAKTDDADSAAGKVAGQWGVVALMAAAAAVVVV